MPDRRGRERAKVATSTFLRLPAELRDKIYDLLLGGLTIHVGEPGGNDLAPNRKGIFCCEATTSDEEASTEASSKNPFPPTTVEQRHEDCFHLVGAVIDLAILSVCKQIHREALQVIFHANTFTFSQPRNLQLFLHSLSRANQEDIASIQLYSFHKERYWAQPLPQSLTTPLSGLRHLRVFVELAPGDLVANYYHDVLSTINQDLALSGLAVFRSCPLEKVHVTILDTPLPKTGLYSNLVKPTKIEVRAWERRVERMILHSQSTVTEELVDGVGDAYDNDEDEEAKGEVNEEEDDEDDEEDEDDYEAEDGEGSSASWSA